MNDFELELKMKGVPVPERPEAYWHDFPARVTRQLGRPAIPAELREPRWPRLSWEFAASAACLLLALLLLNQPLRAVSSAMVHKEMVLRHELNALPKGLRLLMADEHGLHYLIADKE